MACFCLENKSQAPYYDIQGPLNLMISFKMYFPWLSFINPTVQSNCTPFPTSLSLCSHYFLSQKFPSAQSQIFKPKLNAISSNISLFSLHLLPDYSLKLSSFLLHLTQLTFIPFRTLINVYTCLITLIKDQIL